MRTLTYTLVAATAFAGCAPGTESSQASGPVMALASDGSELGQVNLAVACTAPANELVHRGLALYHNMTFTEAETAFRNAADADAECAIAHWGVAMSYVHTLWPDSVAPEQLAAGREAIERARAASTRSASDDAYIAAIAGYYADAESRSEAERLQGFHDGWAAAHEANLDDEEAKALYALSLIATAPRDPEYPNQRRAGELLAEVRGAMPNHPGALHYTIHAFDSPALAADALDVAHAYGSVIPENSHALHMTSHIFTRLGHWDDSIAYNRRAADVAASHPVGGRVSHHYLHALDYLAYAYLQQGRDDEAAAVSAEMNGLGEMHDSAATAYAVAAIPARLAIEVPDWEGPPFLDEGIVDSGKYPAFAAMPVFANGLAWVHTGNLDSARAAIEQLDQLRDAAAGMPGAYDWSAQVEIQRLTLQSWLEYAEGNLEAAGSTAMAAVMLERDNLKNPVTPGVVLPATEALAEMAFAMENYADALMFYLETLERNPNRYRSLLGAGDSAKLMGRDEEARTYYEQLLEIAPVSTRDDLAAVREFLAN
ncbi:MAG: hypothetical protein GKS06_00545 [Acidobacteria bacterium]|nr:hypothetical protein [Acidobacteriota bacterium]